MENKLFDSIEKMLQMILNKAQQSNYVEINRNLNVKTLLLNVNYLKEEEKNQNLFKICIANWIVKNEESKMVLGDTLK